MAELRIHQEQLDEDGIRQLIDICPFGAISAGMERWKLTPGCRMQAVCEKGPGGALNIWELTGTGD